MDTAKVYTNGFFTVVTIPDTKKEIEEKARELEAAARSILPTIKGFNKPTPELDSRNRIQSIYRNEAKFLRSLL